MPTLRQLEVFVQAAQDCNFRRTADRLLISQVAVSKHIAALERDFGGALFLRRTGKAPVLSPLGEQAATRARQVLAASRTLHASRIANDRPTNLYCRQFMLEHVIRPATRTLRGAGLPDKIKFVVCPDDQDAVIQQVVAGEAAFALYRTSSPPPPRIRHILLGRSGQSLYLPAGRGAGDEERWRELPLLIPWSHSTLHGIILRRLESVGFEPVRVIERGQFVDLIIDEVIAGGGMAFLMDDHAKPFLEAGSIERAPLELPGLSTILLVGDGIDEVEVSATVGALRALFAPTRP